jgi:hypothetical protein
MRLNQRGIIESVNDQLKNMCEIEHTRYRKVANFMVNLVAGLIACTYQPQKPSLHEPGHQFTVLVNEYSACVVGSIARGSLAQLIVDHQKI